MCSRGFPTTSQIRTNNRAHSQWRRQPRSRPSSRVGGRRGRTGNEHAKAYPVARPWPKTVTGHGFSEIPSYISKSRCCTGATGAVRADPPTPGVSGEGGKTPRRTNHVKRRTEAVEIRREQSFRPACELR